MPHERRRQRQMSPARPSHQEASPSATAVGQAVESHIDAERRRLEIDRAFRLAGRRARQRDALIRNASAGMRASATLAASAQGFTSELRSPLLDSLPVDRLTVTVDGDLCAICQDSLKAGDIVRRLPCTHTFHQECIAAWLTIKSTCPLDNLSLDRLPGAPGS
eukprot:gnl/TRDRNA2_/TRDRNA2_56157_c0_seq1.p1 gnl/TRDRNA2_/TRDRNA2_56157_c0~~gnl/TRDRNA2_/TRDRNA2_56157_c0_seq1.p1  ORF type:complete len:174 (+),score=16.60 gnl/TRDRNA2_/TRDRNA2_56157_c0_seq1:34-522(+)